jgi:NADPH-dependent 2,4-dienoyl-CoA reductase/sulfur reductase-like enzyme/nitrite reductase/ring-hydroxylating ferredoxin subunit
MAYKEIAKTNDLKNGEMRSYKIDDEHNVLLCRINDEYSAVGAFCTHYGAPLEEGVLKGETIMCPLHHACFNAKNGNLLEPPAMDALPVFELKIEGDKISVNVPDEIPGSRKPDMVKKDTKADSRVFVLLGAGASAYFAAQSMRENGFRGNIIMVTSENRSPYDRPNLSKDYLAGSAEEEWMPLRPDDFFNEYGIEIKQSAVIMGVDFQRKQVSLESNEHLKYDKLLIATGGIPNKLNIKGADLKNIFYLRSFDDADQIIASLKDSKNAVVIGASFIAMETAGSLVERKINVTVIAPEEIPFERNFGKEIGMLFRKEHEKNGVVFKLKSKIKEFKGTGKVESVVLESGEEIKTDLVVIGIGVKPATGFLDSAELLDDKSLKTDSYLRVRDDVYASGDIASFPDFRTGNHIRIEHWRLAQQLGRTAGANMSGKEIKFSGVPFFWTQQAGMTLRYVGFVKDWDEILIDGSIAGKKFIAYFIKNNTVMAAAAMNRDKELDAVHLLMKEQKLPEVEALRDNSADILELI